MANRYPAIDLNLTCTAEEVQVGDNVQVDIVLQRDIDGADVTPVVTSYYPVPKEEVRQALLFRRSDCELTLAQGWWVVIGDTATDTLLAIKVLPSRAAAAFTAAHVLAALLLRQKPQGFSLLRADRSWPKNVSAACRASWCFGVPPCRRRDRFDCAFLILLQVHGVSHVRLVGGG